MKFRNRRNGIVLDLPENFSGKYWEPVDPAPVSEEKPKKKSSVKKKTVKK